MKLSLAIEVTQHLTEGIIVTCWKFHQIHLLTINTSSSVWQGCRELDRETIVRNDVLSRSKCEMTVSLASLRIIYWLMTHTSDRCLSFSRFNFHSIRKHHVLCRCIHFEKINTKKEIFSKFAPHQHAHTNTSRKKKHACLTSIFEGEIWENISNDYEQKGEK